jgi:hypothetical protein
MRQWITCAMMVGLVSWISNIGFASERSYTKTQGAFQLEGISYYPSFTELWKKNQETLCQNIRNRPSEVTAPQVVQKFISWAIAAGELDSQAESLSRMWDKITGDADYQTALRESSPLPRAISVEIEPIHASSSIYRASALHGLPNLPMYHTAPSDDEEEETASAAIGLSQVVSSQPVTEQDRIIQQILVLSTQQTDLRAYKIRLEGLTLDRLKKILTQLQRTAATQANPQ